jgi:hypothetical protein
LLPRANAAACLQLAKADFASSGNTCGGVSASHELEAKIEALRRQAVALGAEPSTDVPPWGSLGVRIGARRERVA